MGDAVLQTLRIMSWLGIILGILVIVNIICSTITNVHGGEDFSWKKMLFGIVKALVFYLSSAATGVAFTMLPFINEMITNAFGAVLISNEVLNTLSSVAILSIIIAAITIQGRKAINGILKLVNLSSNVLTEEQQEEK